MQLRGILATLALAALSLPLTGCPTLRLRLVNASVRRPSNVAVYFSVDRTNGDPVAGLTAEQFRILEDGRPVSVQESRQTILNPRVSAVHYTMLLMDMSGSVTESGQLEQLQAAARVFTERVERFQRVGVYAFDGSTTLQAISPFTASSAASGINSITSYRGRDPSTNLHGGVVQGLRTLRRALDSASEPLRFGTLVVFTDGTDRAARVSREEMMAALNEETHREFDVFAIGVGTEIDPGELRAIGRNGTVLEQNPQAVRAAFEQIAGRIEAATGRYYLLSYCSPARAGEHDVRIEANAPNGGWGGLEYHFDANGFGPNCDPNTPPSFDLTLRGRRNEPTRQKSSGGFYLPIER